MQCTSLGWYSEQTDGNEQELLRADFGITQVLLCWEQFYPKQRLKALHCLGSGYPLLFEQQIKLVAFFLSSRKSLQTEYKCFWFLLLCDCVWGWGCQPSLSLNNSSTTNGKIPPYYTALKIKSEMTFWYF